jgi:two-component system OmpR family response regulator
MRPSPGTDARKVVLVVDPDPLARAAVIAALERVGFAGHEASTARQALEDAATKQPCCVLLDARLPDLSGYEVCQSLKAEHGRRLPVIFVSGDRTAAIDRVTGFLLGADDYMAKPFHADELVARVRAALRRADLWAKRSES